MDTDDAKTDQRVRVLNEFKLPHKPHFNIVNKMFRGQEITDNFPHLQNYGQEWTAVYEPSGATLLADKCLQALQVKSSSDQLELLTSKVPTLFVAPIQI
jgi:hypothetical protein